MKDLDDFADWLEDIGTELADPSPFFESHLPRYLELARRTAVQTLLANRPLELDDDLWRENVFNFAELIITRFFGDAFTISFEGRTEFDRDAARNRHINLGNFTPVTWQDVYEWVTAGREAGGKDKTLFEESERMSKRSDRQITYDVHNAIRQHQLGLSTSKDFSAITARLEDWINSKALRGDMNELLRLVFEAWLGVLDPVLERDFADWITYDVLGS